MRSDPILVRRLEELCFNAWPALRTVLVGGWVVRLAEGHARRANGASPIHPTIFSAGKIIDRIDDLFLRAGIEPVYRLTGLEQPEFERALRARGYADFENVIALRSPPLRARVCDEEVIIDPIASDLWLQQALTAYGYDMEIEPALRRIFDDIVWPCGFATVRCEGQDVAWGLAVAEADYVGLFDIVVAPDRRGEGFGRRLVSALLAWGFERGARNAYLHVRTDNDPALALYRSLNFAEIYLCRHFARPPSEAEGDGENASIAAE